MNDNPSVGGGSGTTDYLGGFGSLLSGASGIVSAFKSPKSDTKQVLPNAASDAAAAQAGTNRLLLIGGGILAAIVVIILVIRK